MQVLQLRPQITERARQITLNDIHTKRLKIF